MAPAKKAFLLTILLAIGLAGLLVWKPRATGARRETEPLLVYCAAGLKPAVDRVAAEYTRCTGVPIHLQYGGSGTLLSNLRVARRGDLFLAADASYLDLARSNGLVAETIPVARLTPVIAVRRGNPKRILGVADLTRADVATALANPEAASVGRTTRELLTRAGTWAALAERVKVLKPTVNDVANDIKLGAVDAGVVWDAVVHQYPDLEAVTDPVLSPGVQEVMIAVLAFGERPTAALRLARYLTAADAGLKAFAEAGYQVVDGDRWEEQPEVVLYSGGVNRMAIEPALQRFEAREGVRVTRIYNGCGILVAQMKAGQKPDAYLACDVSFLTPVQEWFGPGTEISETDIILLVSKGNPLNLRSLTDLARPGLRIGMANPQQSTLGALTVNLLDAAAIRDAVMANVRSQTPTADLLVNQMRAGSLDAVIVYAANTSQLHGDLTVVPLPGPGARAVQPFAVGRNSDHRHLMERLLAAIRSAESRTNYEAIGFRCRP